MRNLIYAVIAPSSRSTKLLSWAISATLARTCACSGLGLGGACRRFYIYTCGVIVLTRLARAGCQTVDEICHTEKVFGPETALARGGNLECVYRRHAGPAEWDVMQVLRFVPKVNPVFAPRILLGHQLELATE